LPALPRPADAGNRTRLGAYVVSEPADGRAATLVATGSEVSLAMEAAALLAIDGIDVGVVSMPCWELFEEQSGGYQNAVLGAAPIVAVEAAARMGWDRWIGRDGAFIGMTGFGASAPIADLYKHFGFTPERIADQVRALLA
jgi:transketolase